MLVQSSRQSERFQRMYLVLVGRVNDAVEIFSQKKA